MIGLVIHRDLVAPKASTSWRCFSKSTYSPMMPSPSNPQHNAATPSSMVGMVLFSLQASQFHYITVACVWPCWVAALVWLVLPLSRVLGVLWSVHTHLSQHLSLAFFPQTLEVCHFSAFFVQTEPSSSGVKLRRCQFIQQASTMDPKSVKDLYQNVKTISWTCPGLSIHTGMVWPLEAH